MILSNLGAIPATDPNTLMRLRDSIYAADLFIAAVAHLNLFSWLNHNPADIREICYAFKIQERPADVMLTLLKAYSLLEERNNKFYLTKLAEEHLVDSADWCLKPYISSLKNRPSCLDMLRVLQTGEPASWGGKEDEQEWALAMEKDEFSEQFTSAMDSRGAFLAPSLAIKIDFSNYNNLLDIGGASGIYAAAILFKNKHMKASILEKPPVDRIARYSIDKRGMADKISIIAGDMFKDDLPKGYDVHLFSNILHDWDIDDIKKLLKKSYMSLLDGGMIVVHDAHINSTKSGPPEIAEYSVLLMYSTKGKCYSFSEIGDILSEVGFSEIKIIPSVAKRSIILAKK